MEDVRNIEEISSILSYSEMEAVYDSINLSHRIEDVTNYYAKMDISDEIKLNESDLVIIAKAFIDNYDCNSTENDMLESAINNYLAELDDSRSVVMLTVEVDGGSMDTVEKKYKANTVDEVKANIHTLVEQIISEKNISDMVIDVIIHIERNGQYYDAGEITCRVNGSVISAIDF